MIICIYLGLIFIFEFLCIVEIFGRFSFYGCATALAYFKISMFFCFFDEPDRVEMKIHKGAGTVFFVIYLWLP